MVAAGYAAGQCSELAKPTDGPDVPHPLPRVQGATRPNSRPEGEAGTLGAVATTIDLVTGAHFMLNAVFVPLRFMRVALFGLG